MSGFTGRDAEQMLAKTDDTQNKTKDSITRMKQQTAESEAIGTATLDELRRQGEQMDEVNGINFSSTIVHKRYFTFISDFVLHVYMISPPLEYR